MPRFAPKSSGVRPRREGRNGGCIVAQMKPRLLPGDDTRVTRDALPGIIAKFKGHSPPLDKRGSNSPAIWWNKRHLLPRNISTYRRRSHRRSQDAINHGLRDSRMRMEPDGVCQVRCGAIRLGWIEQLIGAVVECDTGGLALDADELHAQVKRKVPKPVLGDKWRRRRSKGWLRRQETSSNARLPPVNCGMKCAFSDRNEWISRGVDRSLLNAVVPATGSVVRAQARHHVLPLPSDVGHAVQVRAGGNELVQRGDRPE